MIYILDLIPAPGDDVDMPDERDHFHPLGSWLQIIKSSLQTFMRPIFPPDSLLDPIKYFEVFVKCRFLLEPQTVSRIVKNFSYLGTMGSVRRRPMATTR
jgi:hypothetical protein